MKNKISDWAKYNEAQGKKKWAQEQLAKAIRQGIIVRPVSCERCDRIGRIHGHHEDYDMPFDVKWLCHQCHAVTHANTVDDFNFELARNLVKSLGITQIELSRRLQVNYQTLSHILNGYRRPTEDLLNKLCSELGVPPMELRK